MDTLKNRRFNKLLGKSSWFQPFQEETEGQELPDFQPTGRGRRRETDQRRVESIMMVPYTKNSKLKQKLQEKESKNDFQRKIKYVESLGLSLANVLCKKDPAPTHCGCQDCFPCGTKVGQCMRQGVVYKITCLTCQAKGEEVVYA